jgi:hypothetical protein
MEEWACITEWEVGAARDKARDMAMDRGVVKTTVTNKL